MPRKDLKRSHILDRFNCDPISRKALIAIPCPGKTWAAATLDQPPGRPGNSCQIYLHNVGPAICSRISMNPFLMFSFVLLDQTSGRPVKPCKINFHISCRTSMLACNTQERNFIAYNSIWYAASIIAGYHLKIIQNRKSWHNIRSHRS